MFVWTAVPMTSECGLDVSRDVIPKALCSRGVDLLLVLTGSIEASFFDFFGCLGCADAVHRLLGDALANAIAHHRILESRPNGFDLGRIDRSRSFGGTLVLERGGAGKDLVALLFRCGSAARNRAQHGETHQLR